MSIPNLDSYLDPDRYDREPEPPARMPKEQVSVTVAGPCVLCAMVGTVAVSTRTVSGMRICADHEVVDCAECGHVVPVDGTDTEEPPVKIGDWWYCRFHADEVLGLDRFDDVSYDMENE